MQEHPHILIKNTRFSRNQQKAKLVLSASVYCIWRERNNIKHGNQLLTEEKLVQKLRWEVRTRVMSKGKFPRSKENYDLCKSWDLLENMLEEVAV